MWRQARGLRYGRCVARYLGRTRGQKRSNCRAIYQCTGHEKYSGILAFALILIYSRNTNTIQVADRVHEGNGRADHERDQVHENAVGRHRLLGVFSFMGLDSNAIVCWCMIEICKSDAGERVENRVIVEKNLFHFITRMGLANQSKIVWLEQNENVNGAFPSEPLPGCRWVHEFLPLPPPPPLKYN